MAFIHDGFPTIVTFSAVTGDVSLYIQEKEVTPPSLKMGGEWDTTTLANTTWRTSQPKKLLKLGATSIICKYDPSVYTQILPIMGINTMIRITFPDNSTYDFRGWLDEFTPNSIIEGEMATASVVILPANQTDAGVETSPVYETHDVYNDEVIRQFAKEDIQNLAAGVDLTDYVIYGSGYAITLSKIGILTKGTPVGIDNSNTVVLTVKNGAGNIVLTKTYNTATQPPTNDFEDLGALSITSIAANDILTLTMTQGTTANMPAFSIILE